MNYFTKLVVLAAVMETCIGAAVQDNYMKIFKRDYWGPAVSTGPTKSHIISATTITRPGRMPSHQNGGLYLWPGMSNGTGPLLQTIVGSQISNTWCGATGAQWCISCEEYSVNGQTGGVLHSGSLGSRSLNITFLLLNESNWTWQQTVTDVTTGHLLAEYTTQMGPMTGWGTAVECNQDCTPTVATQTYDNTKIVLATPDITYGTTVGAGGGATYKSFKSPDKGKTWYLEQVVIPAINPGGK